MSDTPTADDYASIDRAADELQRRGWRYRFSLNETIEGWSSFVDLVETGYSMTIDDYANDLSIRQSLEEARPFLTPRVAESMDARTAAVDDRFRNATDPTFRPLPGAGAGWWSSRLPKVLIDDLAEDAARMNLRDR